MSINVNSHVFKYIKNMQSEKKHCQKQILSENNMQRQKKKHLVRSIKLKNVALVCSIPKYIKFVRQYG